MRDFDRIKYEDLYRQAWLAQNIKDKVVNPRWNGGVSNSALNGFKKHTSVNRVGVRSCRYPRKRRCQTRCCNVRCL